MNPHRPFPQIRPINFLRWLITLSGTVLFVVVLAKTGVRQICEDVVRQGWTLVLYIVLSGVENGFHAASSLRCVQPQYRDRVSWWRMFLLYHLAYAINLVTPSGDVGGDVARGIALRKYMPSAEAASAVLINKFTFTISRMLLAAGLTGMAIGVFPFGRGQAWAIGLASALMTLALCAFAVVQAKGLFGVTLIKLARIAGRKRQDWVRLHVGDLDLRLREFYIENRGDVASSVIFDLVGFGIGVLQRTLFIGLLLDLEGRSPGMLLAAGAATWGITNLLEMLFFFMVGRIGVQEGGFKVAFESIGLSGQKGVAMSIVERINQFFWTALGLGVSLFLMRQPPPAEVIVREPLERVPR